MNRILIHRAKDSNFTVAIPIKSGTKDFPHLTATEKLITNYATVIPFGATWTVHQLTAMALRHDPSCLWHQAEREDLRLPDHPDRCKLSNPSHAYWASDISNAIHLHLTSKETKDQWEVRRQSLDWNIHDIINWRGDQFDLLPTWSEKIAERRALAKEQVNDYA